MAREPVNPYERFLGSRNPMDVISSTAAALGGIVDGRQPADLERRMVPTKWNAREILCHLADSEIAFGFRLRQTLAGPRHVIQPFDQNKWAAPYHGLPARAAVDAFTALRNWNLALISAASPDSMQTPVTHPERGDMTFLTIVETMAGHDLNHLQQLAALLG